MLLFLYIYGTNIGICNSGVGKMKHPAFIFVLTKKEVLMVSVELKQEKHNALVSFLMIVIAVLFLLYMGSSLVHSTKAFWENYSIGSCWNRRNSSQITTFVGKTYCR